MKYIKEYNSGDIMNQLVAVVEYKLNAVVNEISFLKESYDYDMWTDITFGVEDKDEKHAFNNIVVDIHEMDVDRLSFHELEETNVLGDILTSKMFISIVIETNAPDRLRNDIQISKEKERVDMLVDFLKKQEKMIRSTEKLIEKYGDQLKVDYRVDENELSLEFNLIHDFNEAYQVFKNMAS